MGNSNTYKMKHIENGHFNDLKKAKLISISNKFEINNSPSRHGVFIIYNEKKQVLYVGRTPRAKEGLKQRIINHLTGASSFYKNYLEPENIDLKKIGKIRCIEIEDNKE